MQRQLGQGADLQPLVHQRRAVFTQAVAARQIQQDIDAALAVGQIRIQGIALIALGLLAIGRRIEGDGAVDQRRQALHLHRRAGQAEIALETGDIPEAAVALHQVGETAVDQYVDGHALVAFADGVVIHLADRDFTVVDQRAAVERAEIVGVQVDHQLAGVQAVFRLGIERGEVSLLLAAAGHHADIVAADQGIKPGDPGQRGFGRHQPELSAFAQRVFQIAFDAGLHHDAAQIFAQADFLHRADLYALIAYRRAAGDDARRRLEIDGDGGAALLDIVIDQPPGDQQGDERQ